MIKTTIFQSEKGVSDILEGVTSKLFLQQSPPDLSFLWSTYKMDYFGKYFLIHSRRYRKYRSSRVSLEVLYLFPPCQSDPAVYGPGIILLFSL